MYKSERRAIFTARAEKIFEKNKPSFPRKNDAVQAMGESESDNDGLMFPEDENEETEEKLYNGQRTSRLHLYGGLK